MAFRFDVFLSHASLDKPRIEELAERLRLANLEPWLDKWHLIPGNPWQVEIEDVLAECATCAVFIGPGSLGPWHHEEMRLAISRRVEDRERAFRVIPVLLPGVDRPARSKLPGFLAATTWVEFRDSIDDPEAFHRLVCGIKGIEPGPGPGVATLEGRNPYRGLGLFDVDDAPLFFGREALTEWLLDALKPKPAGLEDRFLAIVGASGSGKSSLARAGLLAALKDGKLEGSASWPRVIYKPGREPFSRLATALTKIAPQAVAGVVFDRVQGRKDGDRSLHVAANLILGEPPTAERLVVLVDQFEEIFTLCPDEAERRDLIANLLHAATVADGRTIVVLTMRADFYHRCAAHADLAAALSDRQVLVGPMTDDEIRRAIERPARLAGLEPESGLVEILVNEVRGRPGSLPLLQFALQELWNRRKGPRLTIQDYRDIGGVEGVLQHKADSVFVEFSKEQKAITRRLFLRLVQQGEGSEDTRRRAPLSEVLSEDPAQSEAIRAVITRLSDRENRLLTTDRDQTASGEETLDVAHEALIRGWPQLRSWIEADRAGLRTHRRLTEAAREWDEAAPEAKEGALHVGARLAVASEWAATHDDDLSPLEKEFLKASLENQGRRQSDEADKNIRLAKAERRLRETAEEAAYKAGEAAHRQEKLGRRFLLAAVAASVLAAMSGGLAIWANKARDEAKTNASNALKARNEAIAEAERADKATRLARSNEAEAKNQAQIATSRHLVVLSGAERSNHFDRSLLLAVEALRANSTHEALDGLHKGLAARPAIESFLHHDEREVIGVAFSPDGKTLAAAFTNGKVGGVMLWDAARRVRVDERPLAVAEGGVNSVAFSPDGKTLIAGYGGLGVGGVVTWDVARRERLAEKPLAVVEGEVIGVAFSPDGGAIAAGYGSRGRGGVVLFDVSRQHRLAEKPLEVAEGIVNGVAFSPDGKAIAAAYGIANGGGVVTWNREGLHRTAEKPLEVAEGHVNGVAFSPDGQAIAAGYGRYHEGGGVVLFNAVGRERLAGMPLAVAEGEVVGVAFSPDGRAIAAAFENGYRGDLPGFGFGSNRIGTSGGVVEWDVEGRSRFAEKPWEVAEGRVNGLAFSPDGKDIATAFGSGRGERGGVLLLDSAGRARLAEKILRVDEGNVTGVAFSPDGKIIAAAYGRSYDGGVVLLNAARLERLTGGPLVVAEGSTRSVIFGPEGKTIAVAYGSSNGLVGGVVLFDVVGRSQIAGKALAVAEGPVNGIAFSPDGKTLIAGYEAASGNGGGVVLFDVAGHHRLIEKPLEVAEGRVNGVAFSPDGKLIAAAYGSRGVIGSVGGAVMWEAAGHGRIAGKSFPVAEGSVNGVAFSPDGKTIAAVYGPREDLRGGVVEWNVEGRSRIAEDSLAVAERSPTALAFSPDGKVIAIAEEKGVELWGAAGRKRLIEEPLAVDWGGVNSIAFSPDGKTLVAAYGVGGFGAVMLWDVDFESWMHKAGVIANRNLTRAEWWEYCPDRPYRKTFDWLPEEPVSRPTGGAKSPTPTLPNR